MTRSSLAGVPHHFGSRLSVTVCAPWSIESRVNGPAVTGIVVRQAVLNASGVAFSEAGKNGLNRPCHSAKVLPNVTTAWRSSTPRTTDEMSEYPVVPEVWKAGFEPLLAFQ